MNTTIQIVAVQTDMEGTDDLNQFGVKSRDVDIETRLSTPKR